MSLEDQALHMALETFLSSDHDVKEHEAIMEALQNNDQTVLDELGVTVWAPFESYPLDELCQLISGEEQKNLTNLKMVSYRGQI